MTITATPPVRSERKSARDVGFAVGIVAILSIFFLPIPAFMIDLGLAFSIALSVLILMVALWIEKPLKSRNSNGRSNPSSTEAANPSGTAPSEPRPECLMPTRTQAADIADPVLDSSARQHGQFLRRRVAHHHMWRTGIVPA